MHTAQRIIKLLPATAEELARALYGDNDKYARNAVYAHICLARRKYNIISLRTSLPTGRVLYIPGDSNMNTSCDIQKGTEQPDTNDIQNAVERILNDELFLPRFCDKCRQKVYDTMLKYIDDIASAAQNREDFWQMIIALRTMLRSTAPLGCRHNSRRSN